MEDDERGGAQSSRARSPIGGEGVAPMGQYLGPASPFSVSRQSDADQICCGVVACVSRYILSSFDPYELWWYETMDYVCTMHTCHFYARQRLETHKETEATPKTIAKHANISQFIRRASRRFGNLNAVSTASATEEPKSGVSIFSMGDRQLPEVDISPSIPNEAQGNVFVNRYFDFAMATYRFLHQPTVLGWHETLQENERNKTKTLPPIQRAILLLVFATGTLYNVDDTHTVLPDGDAPDGLRLAGERYYQAAQKIIASETGSVQLESVQARLASTLYLLNTSRLNQAWYLFGTTSQLIIALGLHRKTSHLQSDYILSECRKRSFWAAYTLDGYFSVMLGRPPFLNDDYADQDYPLALNDSDITQTTVSKKSKGIDCLITASILHAKLARIVRQASKDQYLLRQISEEQQIQTAANLNEEIAKWQEELPIFLSGAINPASLIPVFRRQVTVLRMGCAHAIMLVNRPFMLSRKALPISIQPHVEECLSAAKQVLELVLDFVADNHMFQGFWKTQVSLMLPLSSIFR
jgi:hypothetical protein